MNQNLTYTMVGDYYYPDLVLPEETRETPLGKYGQLRKHYLKEHKPMLYDRLLLAGKLDAHLYEIDQQVREQVEQIVRQRAEAEGVNEQLKAEDELLWVGLMNQYQAAAEEWVLRQLVYR